MVLTRAQRNGRKTTTTSKKKNAYQVRKQAKSKSRKKTQTTKTPKKPTKTPRKTSKTPKKTPRKTPLQKVKKSTKKSAKKTTRKTVRKPKKSATFVDEADPEVVEAPRSSRRGRKKQTKPTPIVTNTFDPPVTTPPAVSVSRSISSSFYSTPPSQISPAWRTSFNFETPFETFLSHLDIKNPTRATFRLYACFAVLIGALVMIFLMSTAVIQTPNQTKQLLVAMYMWLGTGLVIALLIDAAVNAAIVLEIPLGDFFSEHEVEVSLFTEFLVRSMQLGLLLQIFGQFNNWKILDTVVGLELINLALQIYFKEQKDSPLLRGFSNISLIVTFALCGYSEYEASLQNNSFRLKDRPYLDSAAVVLVVQSLIDGLDFPDQFFQDWAASEALVIALRGVVAFQIFGQAYINCEI